MVEVGGGGVKVNQRTQRGYVIRERNALTIHIMDTDCS